jgi:serine/threonine protein kinase
MGDELIDRVANDLASGRHVDWTAAIASARSAAEREQLESLKIVSQIGRSAPYPGEPTLDPKTTAWSRTTVAPTADNSPEREWGRYRLVQEIGAGSFGSVHRALDPALDLDIAIKILHRHVSDHLLKEQLLREARALAKVRHHNVVRVLGVEFKGERVGLCTEFIEGETLENEVKQRGTFSQSQAVEVGTALCQALSAVHRAGFVHRDVKARNTMRERDTGRIVLMDFGSGRDLEEELASRNIGVEGTALYMAPEVLAGEPASFSSDAYSVGVVLYFVLTGAYPVEADSLDDLRAAHRDGLRTPLGDRRPDLAPSFVRVVERAIASKQKRYARPAALCEDLLKTSTERRPLWVKRLMVLALTFAATVVGLIGLGFVSSTYVNAVLGREGFVDEGLFDWLKWGRKSTLAPFAVSAFTLLVVTLIVECSRLLTRMSAKARQIERFSAVWIHRCSLDNVAVLSSLSLLLSAFTLFATWWYFAPLLSALTSMLPDVSTVSAERLKMLTPEFADYHVSYRKAFVATTIACVMVWYPAVRLAIRTRQPIPPRVAVAGAAVLGFSLVLLDFPYRLLSHDIDFAEVSWNEHTCHVLGRRGDETLIFCGELPPPRIKTVRADAVVPHAERVAGDGLILGEIEAKRQKSIFRLVQNKQESSRR